MEQKIFRTALIGLGRIGWQIHLPALMANPDKFQVCAAVDPLEERGKEAEQTFGIPHSYRSISDMLADQKPDLAVVCSPTKFHAEQCIQLLENGIDVFCDKPVASDLQETKAMFAAADKNGKRLTVFQSRRVFPDTFTIKEILQSGKLGKIYQLKAFIGNYARRNDWQAFKKHGGGMFRNYGVHYVDKMMYLLGEPLEPLMCQTACVASLGDADDVVKIVFRGKNSGIIADLEINQASGYSPYVWAIYGSCGAAYLESYLGEWRLRYFDPAELAPNSASDDLAAPGRQYPKESSPIPFREEILKRKEWKGFGEIFYENLYEYMTGKAEPLVPPSETIALMELLEKCRIMAEGC